jgi:hypothetical protein
MVAQASKTLVDRVMDMETAGGEQDWEKLKSFFTKDALFKVGAGN